MASIARSMPICSTLSGLLRKPAVSIMCKGRPSILIDSFKISRVVPAMSVTMARSCPARALSRLDLPALGAPAITTCIPSCNRLPCWARSNSWSRSDCALANKLATLPSAKKSISSSGKSIAASTYNLR